LSSDRIVPPPPAPTLFPYTTLFRSGPDQGRRDLAAAAGERPRPRQRGRALGPLRALPDRRARPAGQRHHGGDRRRQLGVAASPPDRKSTRLNSSHVKISYAVFCLKK